MTYEEVCELERQLEAEDREMAEINLPPEFRKMWDEIARQKKNLEEAQGADPILRAAEAGLERASRHHGGRSDEGSGAKNQRGDREARTGRQMKCVETSGGRPAEATTDTSGGKAGISHE